MVENRTIETGEVIFAAPANSALIHVHSIREQCPEFAVIVNDGSLNEYQKLIAWLVFCRRTHKFDGRFGIYLQMIPQDFPSMPVLSKFIREDKSIQDWDPKFQEMVNVQRENIDRDFSLISPRLRKAFGWTEKISKAEFLWCYFAIHTRCVSTSLLEKNVSISLAPFFEMINHSNDGTPISEMKWSEKEKKKMFQLTAHRPLEVGEEVTLMYGKYCNRELFVYYGFVMKDNIFDNISLSGLLPKSLMPMNEFLDFEPHDGAFCKENGRGEENVLNVIAELLERIQKGCHTSATKIDDSTVIYCFLHSYLECIDNIAGKWLSWIKERS